MINWNKQNREILEHLWDEGRSDTEISQMFGAGKWAVAKQRSILGLVHHKRAKGSKRAPKTKPKEFIPYMVLTYNNKGQQHFSKFNFDEEFVKQIAWRVLNTQKNITDIVVLKPVSRITRGKFEPINI